MKALRNVVKLFKQRSTYAGIGMVLAAIGVELSDELSQHLIAVGLGVAGLIWFLTNPAKDGHDGDDPYIREA